MASPFWWDWLRERQAMWPSSAMMLDDLNVTVKVDEKRGYTCGMSATIPVLYSPKTPSSATVANGGSMCAEWARSRT